MPKPRVVIDTNVLIGSAYAPGSASGQLLEACLEGELQLVVSEPVLSEYQHVLKRAVGNRRDASRIWQAIEQAESVAQLKTPPVVKEDPSDDKFLAAAVDGKADALITNDRFVLNHDPHQGIRIVRPMVFLVLMDN